jgi:hypothetical protein
MVVQSIASVGEATLSNSSVKVEPASASIIIFGVSKGQPALPSRGINSIQHHGIPVDHFRRFQSGIENTVSSQV